MNKRCPWSGMPCECASFPYLRNGIVPAACEALMAEVLLGQRKVSDAGKQRYRAYLAELEENRRKVNRQ